MGHDIATTNPVLETSDGVTLEAQLALPPEPRAGVVLTHPHPLYGGNMHSIVPSELFRVLPTEGVAALRFNFRGVGGSGGEHGDGKAEALDIVAAVDALSAAVPDRPLLIAGWSFGADVALRVTDARLAGWFLVAAPLRVVDPAEMGAATDPRPKRFAQPQHDDFRKPEAANQIISGWNNAHLTVVPGADHFLVGRTDFVTDRLLEFIGELCS